MPPTRIWSILCIVGITLAVASACVWSATTVFALAGCSGEAEDDDTTASPTPEPETDGDGHPDPEDCDPDDPSQYPGAEESCNGKDDDCDGVSDYGYMAKQFEDADGDGYGNDDTAINACEILPGYVGIGADCDDTDATVYPFAEEVCDGKDNDCDREPDTGDPTSLWCLDADKDTWGSGAVSCLLSCDRPAAADGIAYVLINPDATNGGLDCNDADPSIHPDAVDPCGNGIDEDCSGMDAVCTLSLPPVGDL